MRTVVVVGEVSRQDHDSTLYVCVWRRGIVCVYVGGYWSKNMFESVMRLNDALFGVAVKEVG